MGRGRGRARAGRVVSAWVALAAAAAAVAGVAGVRGEGCGGLGKRRCLRSEACVWAGKRGFLERGAPAPCFPAEGLCEGLQRKKRCKRRPECVWTGKGRGWRGGTCAPEGAPSPPPGPAPAPSRFVTVQGGYFRPPSAGGGGDGGGAQMRFAGTNAYQVPELFARGDWEGAEGILSEVERLGMNVVRYFISSEVGQDGHLWRVRPGDGAVELRENAVAGLDRAVRRAADRNLKVIMVLENSWNLLEADGGSSGADAFIQASALRPGGPGPAWVKQDFYRNGVVMDLYQEYVKLVVQRYWEEPAVMSWELLNEARCEDCPDTVLKGWVDSMAAFIKRLDGNHLVTTGIEGFYSAQGNPGRADAVNPGGWAGQLGQDFVALHSSPDVDFAVVHLWSDNWGIPVEERLNFVKRWVESHTIDARTLGKPLLLEEFGLNLVEPPRDVLRRDAFFAEVYAVVQRVAAKADSALQGSLFWALYQDPDDRCGSQCDGYGVEVSDRSTLAVVALHIRDWLSPYNPPAAAKRPAAGASAPSRIAAARRMSDDIRQRLQQLYGDYP